MENSSYTLEYPIHLKYGQSKDWHQIVGLPLEGAQLLNSFVAQNYPLGMAELKEIKHILEEQMCTDEQTMFGVRIEYQNEIEGAITIVQVTISNQEVKAKRNKKERIWDLIMTKGLDAEFEHEFDAMVRENIQRVEFVKDGIGLRDFLFIATENTSGFAMNVFAALDLDVEKYDEFDALELKHLEGTEQRELVILSQMERFFKETNRTLYIGVGFQENLDYLDDVSNIATWAMEAGQKGVSFKDYLREKREFPQWYETVAIMPEQAKFVPKYTEKYLKEYLTEAELKRVKAELKKLKKPELMKQINNL